MCYTGSMTDSNDTRLDQNVKRVDVGALVTVLNASKQTRHHYYIVTPPGSLEALPKTKNITSVTPADGIVKALMTKMKGERVFYRHDLVIEHIEWPARR